MFKLIFGIKKYFQPQLVQLRAGFHFVACDTEVRGRLLLPGMVMASSGYGVSVGSLDEK